MSEGLEIWLATRNEKKASELRRALPATARVRTLAEIDGTCEVIEDAPDFLGNATKKARETAAWLAARGVAAEALVLADDSGLSVDTLGGRPGVHSARYAGPNATDGERVAKLLAELAGARDRRAHFTCALVAVRADGRPFVSTVETCNGTIATEPSGGGGFGYDPVFVPEDGDGTQTFATMDSDAKHAMSHRGKALRVFIEAVNR